MIFLLLAFLFFFLFVMSHIVCARCGLMYVELSRLFSLALLWLIVDAVVLLAAPTVAPHDAQGVPLRFTSLVLYLLLCLTYIVECSLVPYGSPSMKILEWVNRQAGAKATYSQLKEFLAGERLISTRLQDLVSGGYVSFDGERYRLQARGARVARLMKVYRGLLRRDAGG